jgi:hypothetical protein
MPPAGPGWASLLGGWMSMGRPRDRLPTGPVVHRELRERESNTLERDRERGESSLAVCRQEAVALFLNLITMLSFI